MRMRTRMRVLAPAGVVNAGVGAASTAVAAGGIEIGAVGAAVAPGAVGVVPVETRGFPLQGGSSQLACQRDPRDLSSLSRLPSSEDETPDLRAAPSPSSIIGHPLPEP